MLLTPFIYMSSVGRRHISNVKFNATVDFGTDGSFNLSNVISSGGGGATPNLTTPETLELEEKFAATYLQVRGTPTFDSNATKRHIVK